MIEVKRVSGKAMMRDFIMLPWAAGIYENDPLWIPPLISAMKRLFDPGRGYFFEIGEVAFFLAYRDKIPTGRITAHVNRLYEEKYDRKTGFFGFFESIDDLEVARALFDAASSWLKEKGKKVMNGPQSFSIYDSIGFEAEGTDTMPVVGLFHFAPYYRDLAEACGFSKCIDWYCFLVKKIDYSRHKPYLDEIRESLMKGMDVEFKTLDRRDLPRRVREVREIFNRAWEGNWGHLPLTERQIDMIFRELKTILIPELAIFAEKDGRTIGFAISIPDVNPALRILNGRLYPWRVLRFIIESKKTTRVRTLIMGILPEYRGQNIDDVFYLKSIETGDRMGFTEADCSLIVETNRKMIGALKPLLPERYKTYRIYERPVS